MKKMIQSLLMVTAAAVMLAACKGGGVNSSDPKAVLKEFFDRMAKKDIDGAAKLATKDSKSTMDMMKKGMEMAEKMGKDEKKEEDMSEDFKDVEIGEAKITGETATVPFTNKKKGQSFDFPLRKEDGAWKVDFSMGTLMKMGMDAAGKEGENGLDGMNESGEDIKVDSEDVKKSMESLDSLMKDPKMKEAMESLQKNN
jgi:hypothetical protein